MADETTTGSRLRYLQERLKQERLFVNKEKAEISNLHADILSSCERLYHLSWITRQQWKVVQRVRASPEECSQAVTQLDSARFVDASRHLGYQESKYWEFLRGLRENPALVASTLAYADKINLETSQLIRLLLNSLYGNCLLPQDENYVLSLMKNLIELKISGDEDPGKFFQHHRNSFTCLFGILVESLFSTKLYLTAALHAPIMQVLSEDSLLKKRLPLKCTKFVESLESKLYCFPQSLRWLVCQFCNILSTSGKVNAKDARTMVLKLLFDFLVCPAIIRPEQFGITSDVQISEIALQNLQQIASCLMCSCSSEGNESARSLELFSRIDPACITSFLNTVLEDQKEIPDLPMKKSLPGLCRNSVLITENELHALVNFLRMVEYGEDHRDIINHQELKELLDNLPPPPEAPSTDEFLRDVANLSVDSVTEQSPRPPKKKGPFKAKDKRPHKPSLEEVQAAEAESKSYASRAVLQFNPLAVVSRAEEFKKEYLHRLSVMFQEDEDVLVVSLGYSSIECPGMLSEEKVLGIKKPKNEVESSTGFRKRSSSTKFYSKIKKVMKEESEDHPEDVSGDDAVDADTPSFGMDHVKGSIPNPDDPTVVTGVGDFDLLPNIIGDTPGVPKANVAPDVLVTGHGMPHEHTGSVDLIDFSSEIPAFDSQGAGNRDSAISTSSSARVSSFSSSRSSGAEFPREIIRVGRTQSGITEEDSGFDITGLEHLDAPDFRKRTSEITDDQKRRSTISHRGSTSSGTITGAQADGSNRDSQASFLSFDGVEFPIRSGSSSTADDERELPPLVKRTSRANSLKKRLQGNRKSKGKGSFHGEDDLTENNKKKEKGFFTKMRKGRAKGKTSKTNGARVYAKLAEKTLDNFDIANRLPHPEIEVKTTKDVELILEKYTAKTTGGLRQAAAGVSSVDGNDDDDDDDEAGEEEDDFLDEEEKFENAKRKLRLVLCQADFQNLPLLHPDNRVTEIKSQDKKPSQELMTFLHVQLAEAINLQDRSLSAQLHETIRSIRELPLHSCSELIEVLEKEYKARSPYVAYLVEAHQGLLATHAHLERLVERVERDKIICRDYFIMTCVKLFLESKEKGEINAFSQDFQSLPTPDEKCDLLEDFLQKLAEEMERHPIWSGASEEQLKDTFIATERAILSSIFKSAFYPNGDVDMGNDKTFYEHVTNLQKVIHPNHKAVRVAKTYRKEAPWESAQKELLKINAYKTPTDKLKCVKRCCATIMNLLCMASETSVPGADEFVPALVYVVIHANPPGLLSTVQYITNFYDQRLSGEEAYYWMQFCAAIAFIKTLT